MNVQFSSSELSIKIVDKISMNFMLWKIKDFLLLEIN